MTPLNATLQELEAAGYAPTAHRSGGGHWKVKCEGLPPITVSVSASDINAAKVAVRLVRRILAQNRR